MSYRNKFIPSLECQLRVMQDVRKVRAVLELHSKVSRALLNEAAVIANMPAGEYRLPPESTLIIEKAS
jgi:hypothetical protein